MKETRKGAQEPVPICMAALKPFIDCFSSLLLLIHKENLNLPSSPTPPAPDVKPSPTLYPLLETSSLHLSATFLPPFKFHLPSPLSHQDSLFGGKQRAGTWPGFPTPGGSWCSRVLPLPLYWRGGFRAVGVSPSKRSCQHLSLPAPHWPSFFQICQVPFPRNKISDHNVSNNIPQAPCETTVPTVGNIY